ncbi:MAG: ATPase, partial [Pseudomonadota bacterium]
MSNGHHIRAVGQSAKSKSTSKEVAEQSSASEETASASEEHPVIDAEWEAETPVFETEYTVPTRRLGWIVPTLALLAIAGWSGLYGWAVRDELLNAASFPPSEWVRWIIDWSVPVLLIGVVWLLAMRNSSKEAERFAATATMLSNESAQLEGRLTVVNRELSLAREFLASQSRELDALGRMASERISKHAVELQTLINENGKQVNAIGTASETALENMVRLRDDLPVLANSARDVSNQIGNAGRTAKDQVDELSASFEQLDDVGKASKRRASAVGETIAAALSELEQEMTRIEQAISPRFELLQNKAAEYRSELDQSEAQAFGALSGRFATLQSETDTVVAKLRDAQQAAISGQKQSVERLQADLTEMVETVDALDRNAVEAARNRIAELNAEAGRFDDTLAERDALFLEEMKRRQSEFEERDKQAGEVMAQRFAELDDAIAERREAQLAETEKLVTQSTVLSDQFKAFGALLKEVGEQSELTRRSLNEGLGTLGKQLSDKRLALGKTAELLNDANTASLKVLENIELGVHHTREDLPSAITSAANELASVEKRAADLSGVMLTATQRGEELSGYLTKTQSDIEQADASIGSLQTHLSEQSDEALARLHGLRAGLARLTEESETFAGDTQDRLRSSISALEDATNATLAALDQGARDKVGTLADELSREAVEALGQALREESAEAIGKMEQAASDASTKGREATAQLRDQLAKVNELTGNLEQRIARARDQAEEQVDNDFSRRMALITDSLNSSAIDIASALSSDIADTEWSTYLKGDRGIFTRRAVRLIDAKQAREISEMYQSDPTFNANVSRYIHDFEAMLRSMLSTR